MKAIERAEADRLCKELGITLDVDNPALTVLYAQKAAGRAKERADRLGHLLTSPFTCTCPRCEPPARSGGFW